jgi:hypothetical protein
VPLLIQCSCGHQGTVPDQFVGKEVQCPKCHKLLVPLTADKMENFAAKVLFSTPGRSDEAAEVLTIPGDDSQAQIPFTCPFCGENYAVSADLADKKINCRNCREPSRVDGPAKKKPRRPRADVAPNFAWLYVLLGIVILFLGIIIGILLGRSH